MSEDIEVNLPKLGESIMNATIVQWFKKEGEAIKKDEPLLEVSTDKVNSEIPSPVNGVITKIHAQPDQEMTVGDLLATISTKEGATPPTENKPAAAAAPPAAGTTEMQDYYSPALLRFAREQGVPLDQLEKIQGTGAGGRLTKKDLEAHLASTKEPCPLAETPPSGEGIEHVKMSSMRKAIAENMVKSFYGAPHATLVAEVDVTDVMNLIAKERENFQQKFGSKLTVTSFVARAISSALTEYPLLNSTLRDDTIVVKRFVNLGIAVSVDDGIMVPVIRGVHHMHLHEIAKEVATFAHKSRTNTLSPDDVKEGTITMTNFGMSGIQLGIPIIRHPEMAIVGIGAISKKVVALEDDTFGVRKMIHISLTFDHRVIDGMYGCGFLGALKKHLEGDLELD